MPNRKKSIVSGIFLVLMATVFVAAGAATAAGSAVFLQEQAGAAPQTGQVSTLAEDYKIGARDLLEVRVFDLDQLDWWCFPWVPGSHQGPLQLQCGQLSLPAGARGASAPRTSS